MAQLTRPQQLGLLVFAGGVLATAGLVALGVEGIALPKWLLVVATFL